jgi:hypothetical protein
MPIKNKDGTEYTLRGPNKIMKDQSFWDRDSVILLNFGDWKETLYKDQQVTPIKVLEEFVSRLSPNEVTFNPPPKLEPITIPTVVGMPPIERPRIELEEIHEPVITQNEKIAVRQKTYSCVPIHYTKVTDELYGDESLEQRFGSKFSFDAVPMENNDLTFMFWTQSKLSKDSIVFQHGIERHGRWWQVQKLEEDSGGYIVTAIISSINPDFSN